MSKAERLAKEEFHRRMDRNSSVTISMGLSEYKDKDGNVLTPDEHFRIVKLKSDAEAHAEYDRYNVPKWLPVDKDGFTSKTQANFVLQCEGQDLVIDSKYAYCLILFLSGFIWADREDNVVYFMGELVTAVKIKPSENDSPNLFVKEFYVRGNTKDPEYVRVILSTPSYTYRVNRFKLFRALLDFVQLNVSPLLDLEEYVTEPGEDNRNVSERIRPDPQPHLSTKGYVHHYVDTPRGEQPIVSHGIFYGNQSVPKPEGADDLALVTWQQRGSDDHPWIAFDKSSPGDE